MNATKVLKKYAVNLAWNRKVQVVTTAVLFAIVGGVYVVASFAASGTPVPSVSFPANNYTVSGASSPVDATVKNYAPSQAVTVYVDNTLACKASATSLGFICFWDTTKFNDGPHALVVRSYDAASKAYDSSPVTVNVRNTSATQ